MVCILEGAAYIAGRQEIIAHHICLCQPKGHTLLAKIPNCTGFLDFTYFHRNFGWNEEYLQLANVETVCEKGSKESEIAQLLILGHSVSITVKIHRGNTHTSLSGFLSHVSHFALHNHMQMYLASC